ncbi:hypothetical protein GCM10025793_19820 [Lysobacter lycopersici]
MIPPVPLLDVARLDGPDAIVAREPFRFMVAPGQLDDAHRQALVADFPRYGSAGFFPYEPADCGPALRRLIDEITAPAFAEALGRKLGIDRLGDHPAIVTLSDSVNRRHGTLHTDSRSKVATALVYFNEDWPHGSAGCLRFLASGDDIEAMVSPEILPLYGTLAAFARADNSWHGHLPFEGERRVLQVAWLTSEDELRRKQKRGTFSRWFKKFMGGLDRRFGAGRDVNARHD